MAKKMRVIIKRPDEQYGHVCNISDRLENLQKTVGGYIEVVPITNSPDGKRILMVCNEDGKTLNLEHNFYLFDEEIVGTIFLCSQEGEAFADLPFTWGLAEWKKFLNENRWE